MWPTYSLCLKGQREKHKTKNRCENKRLEGWVKKRQADRPWGQSLLGWRVAEGGRLRRVIVTPPNLAHCQHSDVCKCGCVSMQLKQVCELQGCGAERWTATWHVKVPVKVLCGSVISISIPSLCRCVQSNIQPTYSHWFFFPLCGWDLLHLKHWILFWCKWCSSKRGPTPWQSYCRTKKAEFPPFLCVPEPTYQFNIQPASETAMGYMRTRPCFWHGEVLMRSLCMLFENHAAPLVMRLSLSLSLSLSTHKGMSHKGNAWVCKSIGKTRYRLFAPMRKALPSAITCCLFTQRTTTVPLQNENKNVSTMRGSISGSSAGGWSISAVL